MFHASLQPLILALGLAAISSGPPRGDSAVADSNQTRRPIGLMLSADEQRLWVLNERSGSLSAIDLNSNQIVAEHSFGTRPTALCRDGSADRVLVVDYDEHTLSRWSLAEDEPELLGSVRVGQYPVNVAALDGDQAVVASLWSRQLTFVSIPADGGPPQVVEQLDMPFAPRVMHTLQGGSRLIVADSFGGKLGIIDPATRRLLHVREVPGHNIRGLATTPDERMLIVAHQMLNELAHTVRNDVHWGLLMSNDLRWLRVDSVLDKEKDLYDEAHMHPLGQAGNATGDPSGVNMTSDGTVLVALGGVGEIAIGAEEDFSLQRVRVGKRPTAIVSTRDGQRAYVANTFDDSVSVVDVSERLATDTIKLGEMPELSLADRGEHLFFDARLSHDKWMSCNSCHTDGHTNGMLNDNFSDGSFGAPKRVLSTLGKTDTLPLAWNGLTESFAQQIHNSIKHTMQSDREPREADIEALEAYLVTLTSPPPLDVARERVDPEAIDRGEQLFSELNCTNCHVPPAYTSPDTFDVELADELGSTEFNPPSLRGVSQRGPYFHDNRAATLEDVFLQFNHRLPRELKTEELSDLLAFLRSI